MRTTIYNYSMVGKISVILLLGKYLCPPIHHSSVQYVLITFSFRRVDVRVRNTHLDVAPLLVTVTYSEIDFNKRKLLV